MYMCMCLTVPRLNTGFHKYGLLPIASVKSIGFVRAFMAPGLVTSRASAGSSDVEVACRRPLISSMVVMSIVHAVIQTAV